MDAPKCKVCDARHWGSCLEAMRDAEKAKAYSQAPAEKRVTKLPAPVTKINPPNFVTSGKRGQPVAGTAPMTPAERKRKSRAKSK